MSLGGGGAFPVLALRFWRCLREDDASSPPLEKWSLDPPRTRLVRGASDVAGLRRGAAAGLDSRRPRRGSSAGPSSCARELGRGRRYFPATFSAMHFCQLDLTVHTALLDLKFRKRAYARSDAFAPVASSSKSKAEAFHELLFPGAPGDGAIDVADARSTHHAYLQPMLRSLGATAAALRNMRADDAALEAAGGAGVPSSRAVAGVMALIKKPRGGRAGFRSPVGFARSFDRENDTRRDSSAASTRRGRGRPPRLASKTQPTRRSSRVPKLSAKNGSLAKRGPTRRRPQVPRVGPARAGRAAAARRADARDARGVHRDGY